MSFSLKSYKQWFQTFFFLPPFSTSGFFQLTKISFRILHFYGFITFFFGNSTSNSMCRSPCDMASLWNGIPFPLTVFLSLWEMISPAAPAIWNFLPSRCIIQKLTPVSASKRLIFFLSQRSAPRLSNILWFLILTRAQTSPAITPG